MSWRLELPRSIQDGDIYLCRPFGSTTVHAARMELPAPDALLLVHTDFAADCCWTEEDLASVEWGPLVFRKEDKEPRGHEKPAATIAALRSSVLALYLRVQALEEKLAVGGL